MEQLMQLLTGMVLFLFGMTLMGEHLHTVANTRAKRFLQRAAGSWQRGLLIGFAVTAVIQSSSAVTVLVVALADAGILGLRQAVSVIIGSNLGTTVTAWILCLGGAVPGWMQPMATLLAVCGLGLYLLWPEKRAWGGIILGLFLLLCGMGQMTDAAAPLAETALFSRLVELAEHPLAGLVAGILFTGILQSSSASVGLLQAFSAAGRITWAMAVPLVLGQNIGTCTTVLLASAGGGRNARCAALCHLGFNVAGATVLLPIWLVLGNKIGSSPVSPVGIALIHSGFNLLAGALVVPILSGQGGSARLCGQER